jgi:hypothetical protein
MRPSRFLMKLCPLSLVDWKRSSVAVRLAETCSFKALPRPVDLMVE